jgi:hypothetical protein
MLNINQSSINQVYLELTNVSTINPVYYIFQFINNSTNDEKIFYKADSSTTPANYNLFLIEETSTEDLTDGKLKLNAGQWLYKIYQSGTSSLSLTYSTVAYNGEAFIASGIIWVEEAEQVAPVKHTPAATTKKIHKPNNG